MAKKASTKLLKTVFRHVQGDKMGEFSMDGSMLKVLLELDGKRNFQEVASRLGITPEELIPIMKKLLRLNLVEPLPDTDSVLNHDFFKVLSRELSLAVGPIAEFLIDDAISDLGQRRKTFPKKYAAELVVMLARQIKKADKQMVFKRTMLQRIKDL